MDVRSAGRLIQDAVPPGAATWAEVGAGSGTFTLALASLLGAGARVIAVDRDAAALAQLDSAVQRSAPAAEVLIVEADFREPLSLPRVDGLLLANALHFVPYPEQGAVLKQLIGHVRPNGRLLIVDYDGRRASEWVPYPVSSRRLHDVLREIGLPAPTVVAQRPSRYGGRIYAAWSPVSGSARA